MRQVNIYEAKTQLSRLVAEVERGEEIVIARAGRPVVKLVSLSPGLRESGWAKELVEVDEGWDSPETNAAVAALFFGDAADGENP